MWSPNELLKTEKQRDILSYITLQFFPFKKVPLEHYPFAVSSFLMYVFTKPPLRFSPGSGFVGVAILMRLMLSRRLD